MLKKALLTAAGFLSLATGIVGIFVPLLPTTPFLLLAAACFFRSSPRLHRWITGHRVFGSHIRMYREYHAVLPRTRLAALALLWSLMAFSIIFVARSLWFRLVLAAVAIGVSVHLLLLRRMTPEQLAEFREGTAREETDRKAGQSPAPATVAAALALDAAAIPEPPGETVDSPRP
jgi:uncharacterized membrane protein YbaN (DUF454 family)